MQKWPWTPPIALMSGAFFAIGEIWYSTKIFPRLHHTYCIDKILQVIFSKTWQPCDLPRTLIRTSQSEDIKDYFNQVIFPRESGNVASRISEWQYFNFCLRLPLIYEWFLFFQPFFLIFVCPAPSDQLFLPIEINGLST